MDIIECFLNISRSLDFTWNGLLHHHQRTSLIAAKIGKAIGLSDRGLLELFQAAAIHDLGLGSWKERSVLLSYEIENPWEHCWRGYSLVNGINSLNHLAKIINSHHDHWSGNNPSGLKKNSIPLASRIIHLADRVDILTYKYVNTLENTDAILNDISRMKGKIFDPELVSILEEISQKDSFWFDLVSPLGKESLHQVLSFPHEHFGIDYLLDIARLFAQVVDTKSPFTFYHSKGVASIAKFLGQQLGMSSEVCIQLEIAGLLHDLGKMSVPMELIEKPGKLSEQEFRIMKQHAYYTYWLLRPVTQLFPLAEWASFHHERLNGQGYPFGKTGDELDMEARLIAVSDVFVALKEKRPYRSSMEWDQIARVMNDMVSQEHLEGTAVAIVLDNRKKLDNILEDLEHLLAG